MFLGLDLGTTNVKVLVMDPTGRVVARAAAPVSLHHFGADGVEQDIEEILSATISAVRSAGGETDLSAVGAVGVSAQGGAVQMLDGNDRPVGRVVSWLDGRGRPFDERITREIGPAALAARTGHPRSVMGLGQLLRLRRQSPELLAPPNRVGLVGDVIVGRLCGRRAHDATSLSCTVLLNPSAGSVEPDLLGRVGIDRDQLPDLLSPRRPAGGLTDEIARATGLPPGIPVAPAVHDQYAAALGVVAAAAGDVMFSAGTAWVLLAVADRMPRAAGGVGFVCTHVVEGLFGQILSMGNGGSAVTWALKLTGLDDLPAGEIDRLLEEAGAGAEGLRVRPLLTAAPPAGVDGDAAGRIDGLRLGHRPCHLLRAVVEGLAMELNRHLRMLTGAGCPVRRLLMCGGAAASRVTPQIVADVTDLPVACSDQTEMAAAGAAVIARGLIQPEANLADLAKAMAPRVRTFRPGPDADIYRRRFDRYLDEMPAGAAGEPDA